MNKSSKGKKRGIRYDNQNTTVIIKNRGYTWNNFDFHQKEINESNFYNFNELEIISYYVYTEKINCAETTKNEYLSELKCFYEFLKEKSPKELDLSTTRSIFQQLNLELNFEKYLKFIGKALKGKSGKLYSKTTVHRKISVVKNFLEFLHNNNYADFHFTNKFQTPTIQEYSKDNNKLSFIETKELIQFYRDHPILNALITILVTTGIKLSELCSLKVRNIEYIDKEYWLIIENEGEEKRRLFLLPSVIEAINTYRTRRRLEFELNDKDSSPLFTTANGKAYSPTYLGNYLTTKLNDTNLSYIHNKNFTVTSATLRLTYATICKNNYNDIVSIKESLGHKEIKTTERFLLSGQEK